MSDDAELSDVGRWGESLVADYLQSLSRTDSTVVDVIWPNQWGESGSPYDFEIIKKCQHRSDREQGLNESVFIEVRLSLFLKY